MNYHIEIYENPLKLTEMEFERHFALLPQERRAKVLSYRNKIDRNLSLLAYVLLRRGLERCYGIEASQELRFAYNSYAKPFLADYPEIHFNISHCREAVVCAFARRPIGVDVEGLIEYDEALLERVANAKERKSILDSKDSILAFTILWTKKESYLKMSGIGLVDDLHSVIEPDFDQKNHFEYQFKQSPQSSYVLAICLKNGSL